MSEINIGQIHERFAQSDYGRHLETQTRFNDFKPGWVDTELWCDTLGDDVNNLRHMPHTSALAYQFCELTEQNEEDTGLLSLTGMVHDWGEAVVGDIAAPSKTQEDENEEAVAFREIAVDVFGEDGRTITDMVYPIIFGGGRLADRFRAIEQVGYFRTALIARHQAEMLTYKIHKVERTRAEKEQLVGGLLSLHNSVTIAGFKEIAEYTERYKGMGGML